MNQEALPPSGAPSGTPSAKSKSSPRLFLEDILVSICGLATSAAVAYGSFASAHYWGFSPFTWMAYFVLPIGAIGCGFVAAVGYWAGARWFNHRPSRLLLGNIVLVSLTTYFSIHHLDFTHAVVNGVAAPDLMSFPDYLIAVTENMTYKGSGAEGGVELGQWGWGVAGLQVIGFCVGGVFVYRMLTAIPYCDRCAKYFNRVRRRQAKWKDPAVMRDCYEALARLMKDGQLQAAIDQHATLGESRKFRIRGFLNLELRKCPECESRRLKLTALERRGRQFATVGVLAMPTEESLRMG